MKAIFNIPYGLYIVTTKNEKYNGCIINTLQQVTSTQAGDYVVSVDGGSLNVRSAASTDAMITMMYSMDFILSYGKYN